jgi:hypothetical protein
VVGDPAAEGEPAEDGHGHGREESGREGDGIWIGRRFEDEEDMLRFQTGA